MKFFSTCLLAIAAAAATVVAADEPQHRELQQLAISNIARELLKQVNAARTRNGSPQLCLNSKLATASQVMAVEMAASGQLSTTGGQGSTPTSRATDQQFNTTGVAELVGAGYSNATHAVAEWMKLPDYNQYLLGDFEFLGAGYAFNAAQTYKTFWVLDFAKGEGETCS